MREGHPLPGDLLVGGKHMEKCKEMATSEVRGGGTGVSPG